MLSKASFMTPTTLETDIIVTALQAAAWTGVVRQCLRVRNRA